MITLVPYTDLERQSIANEIRKFAESTHYEHCVRTPLAAKYDFRIHSVEMDERTRRELRHMAFMIEQNIQLPP